VSHRGPDRRGCFGEEDEGLAAERAIDGKTLEVPALEGGVAALGGVAGAMIEPLPGRGAKGDVVDEATRAVVFEGESHVEDAAI